MSNLEVSVCELTVVAYTHNEYLGRICQPIDLETSSQRQVCWLELINIYNTFILGRACRQYFVCDGKKKYTGAFSLRYAHRIDTAAAAAAHR